LSDRIDLPEVEMLFGAQAGGGTPAVQTAPGHELHVGGVEDAHILLGPVGAEEVLRNGLVIVHVGHADDHPAAGPDPGGKLGQGGPGAGDVLDDISEDQAVDARRSEGRHFIRADQARGGEPFRGDGDGGRRDVDAVDLPALLHEAGFGRPIAAADGDDDLAIVRDHGQDFRAHAVGVDVGVSGQGSVVGGQWLVRESKDVKPEAAIHGTMDQRISRSTC
jgi:hypothetical protein